MRKVFLLIISICFIYANDVEYFNNNKEKIIQEIQELVKKEDYTNAFKIIGKYNSTKDKDLINLQKNISLALFKNQKKEKELLFKLKNTNPSKTAEICDIYKNLVSLFPDNKTYIKKNTFFTKKRENELKKELKILTSKKLASTYDFYNIYKNLSDLFPNNIEYHSKLDNYEKMLIKENEEEEKSFGHQPTRINWDGSYLEVTNYLKKVMHDPSSLEFIFCSNVFKSKDGWLVSCQYRGKNGIGATIINESLFTIKQGEVIKVSTK